MTGAAGETYYRYDSSRLEECLAALRPKLRVAVLHSGDRTESGAVIYQTHTPRTWRSYRDVASGICDTLRDLGFAHVFLLPDDMRLSERLERERIHIAWLNTGGVQGYDSMCHAPALLEMLGVPYVGHNPLNSCTLDNKPIFKRELLASGLRTPPFLTWDGSRGPLLPGTNARFRAVFEGFDGPFVVKPVSGRASVHVHVAPKARDLTEVVQGVYARTSNHVLVERYLPGREFCVSVTGPVRCRQGRLEKGPDPFAFAALERCLAPGEAIFTSIDERPITPDRARPLGKGDEELRRKLVALAQRVYREFHLRSLVRIDVRMDEDGELSILEANPKPDLRKLDGTVCSLVTLGLPAEGMSYQDLILGLLADRLDHLLTHRIALVPHLTRLLIDQRTPST